MVHRCNNQLGQRDLDLETGFLAPGKYRLEAIKDGINANSRAEDYNKTKSHLMQWVIIKLNMASGGGWIAHIYPE